MARAIWGGGTATETASWGRSTARERAARRRRRGRAATARVRDGDVGDGEGSTATAMESTAAWRRRFVVGGDDGLAEGEGLIWRHPLAPVLATNRC